ncbi:MAG: 30S ribosomal protein S4 [Candidatus Omnitrophica bacterium]|nr:30S ribosomal protein S4 [Candidatus Omnitrophota bacterium]
MAKYVGPSCRICRREGAKLFLKGYRCTTEKCSIDRRSYKPGVHGQRRVKLSDYGLQLREKQKVKSIYGMLEQQFRNYFEKASKSKGVTGEVLLQLLERRLDNTVFRCCFASSRAQAREMVSHGFIMVNNRKVDRPSYAVNKGDVIKIKAKENQAKVITEKFEELKQRTIPSWLKVDEKLLTATVEKFPVRDDVGFPIQEQLIIELYSK